MRWQNPHDRHHLTIDFLEQLLDSGCCRPEFVYRAEIRYWFSSQERDLADEIIEDLVDDPRAPVEYVSANERRIWLVDAEATRRYIAELQAHPPWFD